MMLIPILLMLADPQARVWPKGIDLPAGVAVDEEYRRQFGLCDTKRRFRGRRPRYGCKGDANAVTALRRLPDGSIAFASKLAVDMDGSSIACGPARGRTDQCPTALMLPDGRGGEVAVDAETIPYIVIPEAGPRKVRGEFARLTGVGVGDFGVVLARGRVVPVIVADTGPYAKLGEGSLALHQALGRRLCVERGVDGRCRRLVDPVESISGDVTTVIFPRSAGAGLTPATIAAAVKVQGLRRWTEAQRRMGLTPR